jgi:hypothetical protein
METNLVRQESSGGTVTYILKNLDGKSISFNNNFDEPEVVSRKKPIFLVKHGPSEKHLFKEKQGVVSDDYKTLLEIINDTESGIPITSKDKQLTDLKSVGRDKSRKSSNISYSHSNNSDLFSIKTDRDCVNFLKPKVFIENGKVRIERPTMDEVNLKLQEEQRKNAFIEFGGRDKVSSLSFKKRLHSDKWDDEETSYFYKCLESFGTDFSILEIVLNPRTRNQIKNKYRKEEKVNSKKIEQALRKFDPNKLFKLLTIIKGLQKSEGGEPINYQKLLDDELDFDEKELNSILAKQESKEEEIDEEDEEDFEDEEEEVVKNSMTESEDEESVKEIVQNKCIAEKVEVKKYNPDDFLDNFK